MLEINDICYYGYLKLIIQQGKDDLRRLFDINPSYVQSTACTQYTQDSWHIKDLVQTCFIARYLFPWLAREGDAVPRLTE